MVEYLWKCNKCPATLKLNYNATETDYLRFKECGCKERGEYNWQENIHIEDEKQ